MLSKNSSRKLRKYSEFKRINEMFAKTRKITYSKNIAFEILSSILKLFIRNNLALGSLRTICTLGSNLSLLFNLKAIKDKITQKPFLFPVINSSVISILFFIHHK